MKISILSIGNELLKGTTVNSNAAIIGKELYKLGITPFFQATVNDSKEDINKILRYIVPFSDVIITTGGLGPTADDLTVKTVAAYFKLQLYKNQNVIDNIFEKIKYRNIDKTKKAGISVQNLKQAFVPVNSEVLMNTNGTAPGIFLNMNKTRIFLLPGPPSEMKPMLRQKVIPEISDQIYDKLYFRAIVTTGISESDLQGIVDKVIGTIPGIDIAYRVSPGSCELTIYGYNQELVKKQAKKIRDSLGHSVLAEGFTDIVEEIVFHLNRKNLTFATAESCTGGMIAAKITDLPGISSSFKGGYIAYSSELKCERLGVKQKTIDKFGAVSHECAEEMVDGLCKQLDVNAGIAVTGIAGPGGKTKEKPVGLVYIAVKLQSKLKIKKYIFNGNRDSVRNRAVFYALNMLRLLLLD
jgi:nicotinamide-nucleotide amidase